LRKFLSSLPASATGVLLERSLAMIIGLLGVLEAGAAYVPLDPTLPEERLATLVEDAGLSAVVTQDRYAALLPAGGAPVVFLADDGWLAGEPSPPRRDNRSRQPVRRDQRHPGRQRLDHLA
jgi:non-ribosomal peptide synthetase component F